MTAQLAAGLAPCFEGIEAGATPEGWRCVAVAADVSEDLERIASLHDVLDAAGNPEATTIGLRMAAPELRQLAGELQAAIAAPADVMPDMPGGGVP